MHQEEGYYHDIIHAVLMIVYYCSIEGKTIPSNCAIKVFKTTLNEFKNREKYIRNDYRFHDNISKQNPRKFIKVWAEKEMRNLIRCDVIIHYKSII